MSSHENQFFQRIDQLVETMTSRVRANSVLLVTTLVTGTTAYIAILMTIWFALLAQSDAIYASLGVASLATVSTIFLIGLKILQDKKKKRRQAMLQTQVVSGLLQAVLGNSKKSNLSIAPLAALAGWALANQRKSEPRYRELTH